MRIAPRNSREIVRSARVFLVLAAIVIAVSCSNDSTRSTPLPPPLSSATVSSPTTSPNSSIGSSAGRSSSGTSQSGSPAFVSMQPGVDSLGASVSIQREGDSASPTIAPMINGGFDPVAIFAEVGDTLLIVTRHIDGSLHPGIAVVSRMRPPSIVRTVPASQRTDVPLNTGILIVFSEPMDSASIVNGISLQFDGVVVPSTITFSVSAGGAIQIAVQPDAPLDSAKTYDIVIASSVQNLLGQSLAAPVLIAFTTVQGETNIPSDLVINSFTMVDFHDTNLVPWEYAPQLLVTNPGTSTIHVLEMIPVTVGGRDASSSGAVCISGLNVGPGQTVQVFESPDGRFPFAYTPHQRAVGSALVRLRYARGSAPLEEITLVGSIVTGISPNFGSGTATYQVCVG